MELMTSELCLNRIGNKYQYLSIDHSQKEEIHLLLRLMSMVLLFIPFFFNCTGNTKIWTVIKIVNAH